jgi:hypothetical protein
VKESVVRVGTVVGDGSRLGSAVGSRVGKIRDSTPEGREVGMFVG